MVSSIFGARSGCTVSLPPGIVTIALRPDASRVTKCNGKRTKQRSAYR